MEIRHHWKIWRSRPVRVVLIGLVILFLAAWDGHGWLLRNFFNDAEEVPGAIPSAHFWEISVFAIGGVGLLLLVLYLWREQRMARRGLSVLERLPVRTGVIDREGNILYLHDNEGNKDNVLKWNNLADIPEIDYPKTSRIFAEVFDRLQPVTLEYEFGDTRRVMRIAPLGSNWFGREAVIWISYDNSELLAARRQAEHLGRENTSNLRKLEEAARLWDAVINAVPLYFFAKDAADDFRYVLSNDAFAAFINRTKEQVIGKTDAELFPLAEDAAFFRRTDEAIIAADREQESSEHATDANGKLHHIQMLKKPFVTASGRRLLLGAGADVSRLHNLVESERITNAALAQVALDDNFEHSIESILENISRQSYCDGGCIAVYNAETGRYRVIAEWIAPGTSSVRGLPEEAQQPFFACGHPDFIGNRIFAVADTAAVPGLETWRDFPMRSVIAAPVFIENALWGVVLIGFDKFNRVFSEIDENIMRSMANIVALAQIRARQNASVARADREKQLILNNIRIPIWLYDANGKLIRVNTAVTEMTCLSEAELLKTSCREVFGTMLPAGDDSPVQQVIATGNPARMELSYRGRDYIIHAEPVADENGKLINVVKSGVDVTELNALAANEKILNVCLEELMSEQDIDGAIRRTLRLIGEHVKCGNCCIIEYRHEHECCTLLEEFVAPGCGLCFREQPDMPLSTAEAWYATLEKRELVLVPDVALYRVHSGIAGWMPLNRKFRVASQYAAGIFLNGKLWGQLGVFYLDTPHRLSDLSLAFLRAAAHLFELILERKRNHEKLLAALRAAEEANRAKSLFLASMSHEIRTPLNAVIGFTELLKDDRLEREVREEYLDSIAASGNALLQLINDVLDLSKLEAGQMDFLLEETDFGALCRDVARIFQPLMRSKNLYGHLEIPETLPLLFVDKLRIRQILFNLIGNAVKFTEAGGWTLRVDFAAGPEAPEGTLTIEVADTGIGMTAGDQQKLFEPFVQSERLRGAQAASNGTGLGLAICRRMLQKMDGRISVASRPDQGSAFTVVLEHVRYVRDAETRNVAVPAAGAKDGEFRAGMRFLLVDDIAMNRKVLEAMLVRMGGECIAAASGPEALALLETRTVDLVLTDVWMPEMDGAQLAGRIHALPGLEKLPVIAVTADVATSENFDIRCFDGLVTKPVTIEKLRELLSRFC